MPDNGLSDQQLHQYLNERNIQCEIISKNELPTNASGNYILNLEDSTKGNGTHWVSAIFHDDYVIYFDSFGVICPTIVETVANKRKIYYNMKQIQDYDSTACGYYCLAFLLYVDDLKTYNNFVDLFVALSQINDTILKHLLDRKGIK
jgi:hypothetical protein